MKTNQILKRPMGNFSVYQRTSDGMFNATTLLKQWNVASGMGKKLDHYFENNSTKEFIDTIESKENLHTRNSVYVKSKASRGDKAGTWMHPLLFIDFAMWINPSFKYDVLKFVYDQLIQFRIEAGDTYREMCTSIMAISRRENVTTNIKNIATALNHIVYGKHEREIRNHEAEEETMRELLKLQIKVTELINDGFIKTYDQLINYLRKLWIKKYLPDGLA
ncbi:MAG TPA: DNA-binding protein [Thermosipho africanus]|nr:DNA-binding protein [Thermosipho africanus]